MRFTELNIKRFAAVGFFISLSVGCASVQEPVSIDETMLDGTDNSRVVIVMTQLPEPDLAFPGAGCLLCVLTAEGMHASLSSHADNLDGTEFKLSKTELADRLREKGIDPIVVDEPLDFQSLKKAKSDGENSAVYDYSELAELHQADYVVVISVNSFGFSREFASYIPASEPVATFSGKGFMVDPKTNTYVWYRPFSVAKGIEGEWDQPPEFPKLTNAFYQAVAEARDVVLAEF